jgi:hypothetical protein
MKSSKKKVIILFDASNTLHFFKYENITLLIFFNKQMKIFFSSESGPTGGAFLLHI